MDKSTSSTEAPEKEMTLKEATKDVSTAILVFFMPLLAIMLAGGLLIGVLFLLFMMGII
jgi:hypothetical protein